MTVACQGQVSMELATAHRIVPTRVEDPPDHVHLVSGSVAYVSIHSCFNCNSYDLNMELVQFLQVQ